MRTEERKPGFKIEVSEHVGVSLSYFGIEELYCGPLHWLGRYIEVMQDSQLTTEYLMIDVVELVVDGQAGDKTDEHWNSFLTKKIMTRQFPPNSIFYLDEKWVF